MLVYRNDHMSPKDSKLTQEALKAVLHYDPETGVFTRRVRTSNFIRVGDVAGTRMPWGHLKLSVSGMEFLAHRLAILYMTGRMPTKAVDHIDGDPANNRFANLREVTDSVNMQNRKGAQKNNKTGLLGVQSNHKRFMARIKVDDKHIYLGTFDTPEEAHAAYMQAKRKMHEGCVR